MAGLLKAAESALKTSAARCEQRLGTIAWTGGRKSALTATGNLGVYAAALVAAGTISYVRSRATRTTGTR